MDFSRLDGNKLVQYLCKSKGVGIFMYDQNHNIVEWNQCMESWTGIRREDCLNKLVHEVLEKESFPDLGLFNTALEGNSFTVEAVHLVKPITPEEGHTFDLHYFPLHEADKSIGGVIVLTAPTTSEKSPQPNQLITSALNTVGDFFKYAPIPVYIVDADLNLKLANQAFYEFAERKPQSIHNLREFVPKDIQEHLREYVQEVIRTGRPRMITEEYVLKKRTIYIYNVIFPVRSRRGAVDSVGGYFIDLTDQVSQKRENKLLLEETLRLNQILNRQNQELQEHEAALNEANKALQEQKQELEHLVEELSDRNYELDQIMYKTSHDLRAPLTSILGLLQLAKSENDPDKLPEYHQFIENRVNKLDSFVKAMLTYAKNSRTEINLDKVKWEVLVQDSLEHVKYLEHYDEMEIQTRFETSEYPFRSDLVRINIILNNLIGNAIKYADTRKDRPKVHVLIKTDEQGATIRVEDNGIGIPQLYIDKVCDMFFRATDRSEGSGLGLYIVKQTVERLQGKLSIESQERQGTTITVFLPHLGKPRKLKALRPDGQNNKKDVEAKSRNGVK